MCIAVALEPRWRLLLWIVDSMALRQGPVGAAIHLPHFGCSIIGSAVFHEPLVSRGSGGIVLVRDIDFAATCDSTLMPFHGQCHVAYVPTDSSILGLSKLARLVHAHSKRLCSPDVLCRELTRAIDDSVPCSGVYIQVCARHLADAARQGHVSAESYTGLFDLPHSTHLKVLPHWPSMKLGHALHLARSSLATVIFVFRSELGEFR